MGKKTTAYARRRGLHKLPPEEARIIMKSKAYTDELGALRLLRDLQPFTAEEVVKLTLPAMWAYESIRTGMGCEDDFDTLAAVVNVSLVRFETIGQEGVDLCTQAQEALMHMRERHRRTGKWGVDALAMRSIPIALSLHEELLTLSNPKQMREALLEVLSRCKLGILHRVENTGNERP